MHRKGALQLPMTMMLGKELLSGLWVRPECHNYCCHFHIRSCLTSCFTFYSFFTTLVATRRRRCLLRSVWVNVMPERLLSVISGILAGGIPGFRIELCCFYHPLAWPHCVVLCFLCPLDCVQVHYQCFCGYRQVDSLAWLLQFIFLLRLNVCNDLAEAMKALDGKKSLPLVVFWSFLAQSVLLVPPSGYLVVSATVRLPLAWRVVVDWLLSSLRFLATKASALWGSALYTMLWVLVMCPSLRHWGIRPRVIQNTLRTPLKLHAPAFLACAAFSLLPLLPSRASALSFLAGLRLSPSPRALVLLVLSARLVVLCLGWCLWLLLLWFVLLAWPAFCFVWFAWCFVVLFVPGWFLCLVFCFWWLLLTSYWSGTLVYFAFTCTT